MKSWIFIGREANPPADCFPEFPEVVLAANQVGVVVVRSLYFVPYFGFRCGLKKPPAETDGDDSVPVAVDDQGRHFYPFQTGQGIVPAGQEAFAENKGVMDLGHGPQMGEAGFKD